MLSGELMDVGATVFQPYIHELAPVQDIVAFARNTRTTPVGMCSPTAPMHAPSSTMTSVIMVWSKMRAPVRSTESVK